MCDIVFQYTVYKNPLSHNSVFGTLLNLLSFALPATELRMWRLQKYGSKLRVHRQMP